MDFSRMTIEKVCWSVARVPCLADSLPPAAPRRCVSAPRSRLSARQPAARSRPPPGPSCGAASLHTAACEQVDLSGTKLIGANFAGAKFSEAMAVGASARAPNSSGP